MHVGKLLARLNPSTQRYEQGRGGIPELTPQDVAAAIAMVPEGLGRELVCRLWWPDGAKLSAKELDRLLMEAQLAEWRARMDRLVNAQIFQAMAETPSDRYRAVAKLDSARARMWPRLGPDSCYAAIRKAVLAEMSSSCLCQSCHGLGHVRDDAGLITACSACEGSGKQKVSDRQRAQMIDRDKKTYSVVWAPVYEWTIGLCNEVIGPAHDRLRQAVA
ncbi:hypothetical protein ACQKIE_16140 [Luteibacter sp. NPDC031894]|uniref:hypothetical protein n=1 Tax=Luteibacter sp. NPDC031894 TaxID=3390572 RepID=UPI003CFD8941